MWFRARPCIIATSLAPSPILSVLHPKILAHAVTTSPFNLGVVRQHKTALHRAQTEINLTLWFSKIHSKFAPLIQITFSRFSTLFSGGLSALTNNFLIQDFGPVSPAGLGWTSSLERCSIDFSNSRLSGSVSIISSSLLVTKLQLRPISSAVWTLSPVKTQTANFAARNCAILSATPSCRRSSIAVAPRSSSSDSILAYNFDNSSSVPIQG